MDELFFLWEWIVCNVFVIYMLTNIWFCLNNSPIRIQLLWPIPVGHERTVPAQWRTYTGIDLVEHSYRRCFPGSSADYRILQRPGKHVHQWPCTRGTPCLPVQSINAINPTFDILSLPPSPLHLPCARMKHHLAPILHHLRPLSKLQPPWWLRRLRICRCRRRGGCGGETPLFAIWFSMRMLLLRACLSISLRGVVPTWREHDATQGWIILGTRCANESSIYRTLRKWSVRSECWCLFWFKRLL